MRGNEIYKMKFSITQESNLEGNKNKFVIDISNKLEEYFEDKNYGSSINYFYIGLICVKPEFDIFFKERKPRYKESTRVTLPDNRTLEFKGVYSYDIKLDYEAMVTLSDEEFKTKFITITLSSLSKLNTLSKKVKDFDIDTFRFDVELFLKKI